jgi:hypothetical protein
MVKVKVKVVDHSLVSFKNRKNSVKIYGTLPYQLSHDIRKTLELLYEVSSLCFES